MGVDELSVSPSFVLKVRDAVMPFYEMLWDIFKSGGLGKIQRMTLNFGSFKEYDMSNRFFNPELEGGAMPDIGVYALSIVRSFVDKCPDEIVSQ